MSNTTIWDAVCQTDPEMTKKVTQRGGFTSIDAYYTVRRLTEQFGVLGHGWGWDADFTTKDGVVECRARFWTAIDGKRSEPTPILTMNRLTQGNGVDEDAGKKALTDALTKWASYLGFSADVFLGKFDDNRYVAELNKRLRDEEAAVELEGQIKSLIEGIKDAASYAKQREAVIPLFASLKAVAPARAAHYQAEMESLKAQHTGIAAKKAGAV